VAEVKARTLAEAYRLSVEFGGYDSLSVTDRVLIEQAATLLLRRPRRREDDLRRINSIGRLLGALRRRHDPGPKRRLTRLVVTP
jgi:hypothetical protein